MKLEKDRGQALVEFAIVVPVFMLLLAAMIQFGIILWGQNSLNQAVRDTGRYAATLNCSATAETNAETRFVTLLAQTAGPWTAASASVNYSKNVCPANKNTAEWVTVVGTASAPKFFPWVPGNAVLTSSVEFRVEPTP